MNLKHDYTFQPGEQNNTAAAVAEFALTGAPAVLDIGSGPGWVSRYLAAEQGRDVTCLDNDPVALAALSKAGIRVVATDLEDQNWYAEVAGESFDVVILADVLEHLRDPGRLLESLRTTGLLRPDGILVISIPNASHQSVVSELLLGDFRYTETGILDETHVRWFTLRSMQRLLERSGFLLDRVHRTTRILESTPSRERALQVPERVRRDMRELNDESEVYQFVLRAVVDSSAYRVAQDRSRFEEERRTWAAERQALRVEAADASAELQRVRELLRQERASFRAELEEGARELECRDREVARLTRRRNRLQREVAKARDIAEQSLYDDSRGVRLAVRVVRKARSLRGRM